MSQFALASFEKSCFIFSRLEALRAPLFHELLTATAEQSTDSIERPVDVGVIKHLSIHDQFVQEVQLLLFWLHADIVFLDALLDELFHLLLAEFQCILSQLYLCLVKSYSLTMHEGTLRLALDAWLLYFNCHL